MLRALNTYTGYILNHLVILALAGTISHYSDCPGGWSWIRRWNLTSWAEVEIRNLHHDHCAMHYIQYPGNKVSWVPWALIARLLISARGCERPVLLCGYMTKTTCSTRDHDNQCMHPIILGSPMRYYQGTRETISSRWGFFEASFRLEMMLTRCCRRSTGINKLCNTRSSRPYLSHLWLY